MLGEGGKIQLELLSDFRCPNRKDFSLIFTKLLEELTNDGTAELHVYPRPMLDARLNSHFLRDCAAAYAVMHQQEMARSIRGWPESKRL